MRDLSGECRAWSEFSGDQALRTGLIVDLDSMGHINYFTLDLRNAGTYTVWEARVALGLHNWYVVRCGSAQQVSSIPRERRDI